MTTGVDMDEIISSLWTIFKPFVGKAMIAICIVATIGILIEVIAYLIRRSKQK